MGGDSGGSFREGWIRGIRFVWRAWTGVAVGGLHGAFFGLPKGASAA